jgi:mono/diheme cytochrome c family protein
MSSKPASERDTIKCGGVKWLIITSLTAGFAAAAQAEDFDIGKSEFQSSCASCHGTDATGKGPVSDQLKIPPRDLTMLAKNNNGVFPTNAVYETIYGFENNSRSRHS